MATPTSPLDLYEALDVIGNGSFGVIRKVRRKVDGVILACKELNFERMSDRDRKQIVAEVNILKDLHHDHIVRYFDRYVDRERGILYILMEYCGGGDLGSIIKGCQRTSRQLPEDTIWAYMLQILLALQYCHAPDSRRGHPNDDNPAIATDKRHQILHRDIKPENVFLDSEHSVKLGDFGLSKALSAASTFASTYVGTPYYMSPELIQEKAYDTKSDIWSLGCLIYELCALKPPFHEAQTHAELATCIRNGRIPPLPLGYSQLLTSTIKSMLNINPSLRPSAQQLLQSERISQELRNYDLSKQVTAFKAQRLKTQQEFQDREAVLKSREQELQQVFAAREAEIASRVAQKDAEIVERESQLRAAFSQWEQSVQQAQQQLELETRNREEALRSEVLEWQKEVKTQWDIRESEFKNEIQRLTELCKRQEDDLIKQRQPVGSRKAPLIDVQNTLVSRLSAAKISDDTEIEETPSRVGDGSTRGRGSRRIRTPLPFGTKTHSKTLSEPQSAMKGVILTDTGEVIGTPIINNPLLNLLNNSPVRSFKGFGRLKDEIHDEPAVVLDPLSSPEDEHDGVDFEPSPSTQVSRLRRPSLARLSRPFLPSLATAPAAVPSVDKDKVSPIEPEPSQSAPPSAAAAASEPADDEDNMPSPFLKRVERGPRSIFKPSRRTSTEASKALKIAAAANAATKVPPTKAATISSSRVSAGRISRSPDAMRRAKAK